MKVTILPVVFSVAIALAFSGCGRQADVSTEGSKTVSVDPAPVAKTDAELLVGTWTDQKSEYQEWMTFAEDGTATIEDGGHPVELAYKVDDKTHTITLSNDGTALEMEYSFVDDDTLEITSDGDTSTLVRDTSEASIPASVDVQAEYLDTDGGLTINALQGLTGPEVVALLNQQGYVCDGTAWENEATGDKLLVRNLRDDVVAERGYAAAMGVGELAEGYVRIVTDARSIATTADLEAVRDAMLQGYRVEKSWLLGGGAYLYSVVSDPGGERYLVVAIANTENEAIVEFKTDAYLASTDEGGIDGFIESMES